MPVYVFQINLSEQWSGIFMEIIFRRHDDADMRGMYCRQSTMVFLHVWGEDFVSHYFKGVCLANNIRRYNIFHSGRKNNGFLYFFINKNSVSL